MVRRGKWHVRDYSVIYLICSNGTHDRQSLQAKGGKIASMCFWQTEYKIKNKERCNTHSSSTLLLLRKEKSSVSICSTLLLCQPGAYKMLIRPLTHTKY